MPTTLRISLVILALCVWAVPAAPQNPPAANAEAALLAEGWGRLAKGDADGAALIASRAIARQPLSSAALALAIDADLVRAGASAALTTYEKWLGGRTIDAAYALRRIARALLIEWSGGQVDRTARVDALRALAADGDGDASTAIQQAEASGDLLDARALAAAGDERSVQLVISRLRTSPAGKGPLIAALAESGSKAAIPGLAALLTDQNDTTRSAAANALGRLGATDAIPALRRLLNDEIFTVRLKAAGALYRLNDESGLPLLTDLSQSEHAAIRVAAAQELAARPDARWQSLVQSLTGDANPMVSLEAAKLIAPHDQALARATLDRLMRGGNAAIRDEASLVVVERFAADLATLRSLLRSSDVRVRVKAAGRVLEMTR
jgi:HEAT repeat protein